MLVDIFLFVSSIASLLGFNDLDTARGEKEKQGLRLEKHKLGIWEIVILSRPPFLRRIFKHKLPSVQSINDLAGDFYRYVFHAVQLYIDVYRIAPRPLVVYGMKNLWDSAESGISLYCTSYILETVSEKTQGKEIDNSVITRAILLKCLSALLSSAFTRLAVRDEEILQNCIKYHFMLKNMHASMNVDLTSADDPEVQEKIGDHWSIRYDNDVWVAFSGLSTALFSVTRVCLQMTMALALIRNNSTDPVFLLACIVFPLFSHFAESSGFNGLWNRTYVAYCVEPAYSRMAGLHAIAYRDIYRADRLSDGAGQYIEREFAKQRNIVGDQCTQSAAYQYENRASVAMCTLDSLSSDFPLVSISILILFALKIMFGVNNLSITSLTILQQISQTISWTIKSMHWAFQDFSSNMSIIRNVYTLGDVFKASPDGTIHYPPADIEQSGAEMEFKDVSFAYPGEKKNAIDNVSFSIKPGQMVVIVGVNGSGKSSIIKLFNRLYNPSSGEILLDGVPIESYRIADVRRCMAILRQDHTPYPLSLRENIAFGLPDSLDNEGNESMIEEAAKKGGAFSFITRLRDGMDTVLSPVKTSTTHFPGKAIDELRNMIDEKEKNIDISGGENQRLAASRTFFRLSGGNIRFLAVDEPTSALDPEGEFELLSKLQELRGGKTVVFITHRFGHLTRFADLILCMKDGKLVEQGTHEELLEKCGEYYKLYSVQAQAFNPVSI